MRFSAFRHASAATSTVLAAWIYQTCNNRTKCEKFRQESVQNSQNEELFGCQCLQRQLWQPKVPYPLWNYNWDDRMTSNTTMEALIANKSRPVPGTTRHIILIRHGQYDESFKEDEKRKLTDLGRMQAELTGRRLAVMLKGINDKFEACDIKILRVSDMVRAKETADIIAKHLPEVKRAAPDEGLNEAIPAPTIPVRPEIDATREIDENRERIEAAFRQYIHRADVDDSTDKHEFEVIVGHGNIIRYFLCRALQLPPEAWLRFSIFNCSLTYIVIKPNGYCSCRLLGDVGHLGYEHTTFSGGHGFSWA